MTELDLAAEAKVVDAVEKRLFIDGKWVEAADGATFGVVDPSTGEIAYAAEFCRHFAGEAVRIDGGYQTAPAGNARFLIARQPVGPCLLITPWNFPMAMGTRKLGPALAAGCASVIKPAHQTPLSMLALMEILAEVGVPAGVVNCVTAMDAGGVMEPLIRSGLARKLSFTGSTRVGRMLLEQCAEKVLRTSLELGGNAPFIVFEDADLDEAVDGAIAAKMRNMGEACTAANRLFVHESVIGEFGKRLAQKMSGLSVGRGTGDVKVGPLIDEAALAKVESLVADAVERGATVLTGGEVVAGNGYFYPPTVLTGVPRDALMADQEIFGPIAPLNPLRRRGGGGCRGQRHGVRAGRLRLHQRPAPCTPCRRVDRDRHGRSQPGSRVEPRGSLRRRQAVRPGSRGWFPRHRRVPRDEIHRHRHGLNHAITRHHHPTRLIPGILLSGNSTGLMR
ncbi:hypothetical protein GCM10009744_54480 [Kribbella alba]|uniref:Aldehyde dehydrogenase domain-containing protein n=1 Tax=Kribbella alba TaxID=190197 RepID=A0ABP4RJ56_9ACTN